VLSNTSGSSSGQLSTIVSDVGDGGGILSDEILDTLERQVERWDSYSYISLNAISGAQSNRAIHLRALVGDQALSILVDSGSSNTFINASMLQRIH
jgi:hypothetical protein